MLEKFKTVLLLFLICLSLILTYQLWFDGSPLEEGIAPRYEHAYFTIPPTMPELLQPHSITFQSGDEVYCWRRGEKEGWSLWEEIYRLLSRELSLEGARRLNKDEKLGFLESCSSTLSLHFEPPVPPELISEKLALLALPIHNVRMIWMEEGFYVLLETEEIFIMELNYSHGERLQNMLYHLEGRLFEPLPPLVEISMTSDHLVPYSGESLPEDSTSGEESFSAEMARTEEGNDIGEGEKEGKERVKGIEGQEEELTGQHLETWGITVSGHVLVPLDPVPAAEMALYKEKLDVEQLVRSFFVDLSMARRIEERDGALYFTDGERGLRIYPAGLVEYTAPRLERLTSSISYGAALQKGAEHLSLYGGWLPGTFLAEARKVRGGYELRWQTSFEGLSLVGETVGSKMILNEQGVSYYRRNFHMFGERLSEIKPFISYREALALVIALKEENFTDNRATLLSLQPVYYLSAERYGLKAIPAWEVYFAETGKVYVKWCSLEILM